MFTIVVFITKFPMHSDPVDIFADSVTLTSCCFRTNVNKNIIHFLIKSFHILYNTILIKTDITNFIKSLHILMSVLKSINLFSKANLITL